mgnify:CR=1 FL=1
MSAHDAGLSLVSSSSLPMWTRQHKRRKTGRLILPVIAAAFLGYFGHHAFQGEYGLENKARLEQQVDHLEQQLAEATDAPLHLGITEAGRCLRNAESGEWDMLGPPDAPGSQA